MRPQLCWLQTFGRAVSNSMSRHYYNYTSCIECEDIEAIRKAIIELLEYEGVKNTSQLPNSIEQSLKYWIVGLFPANYGWTIIKTWSYELLCSQTIDVYQLRLSDLATQLKCNAFHLSVYDGIYGILLEANTIGKIYISGCYHPNFRTETFYNQIIDKPGLINNFYLLEVPDLFKSAIKINRDPEIQRKIEEYDRNCFKENPDWSLLQELEKGHTERIDIALCEIMGNSFAWYCNLPHMIYRYPQKLSSAKCNLLYFCPPANYKTPLPYRENRDDTINRIIIEQFLEE